MAADASIVGLAVAAAGGALGNAYTGDDHWIIEWNARVHQLSGAWRLFAQTYVPPQNGAGNYRPLAMLGFATEWVVGGGAPWVVHAAGVVLYAAVAVAFWRLAARLLPRPAAWAAAALFAVHPVHADVTANAVGQSELWAALAMLAGVSLYLEWRADGAPWSAGRTLAIAALYAVACASKEQGFVLPMLLAAAEATVVADARPWAMRGRCLVRPALALALTGCAYVAVRSAVVGTVSGDYPSFVFAGAPASTRFYTMLGAAPRVAALLLWPAHLAVEYMPQAIVVHRAADASLIGPALLVLAFAALTVVAWRRAPVVTFGLLWMALTRVPAGNLLVPSGVVLAPRILFSPSIGAMLAVGGVLAWCAARIAEHLPPVAAPRRSPAQVAAWVALGAVLVLGVWRSEARTRVWRDDLTLVAQTAIDAPTSYLARYQWGRALFQLGRSADGEREMRQAIALYPGDPNPYTELAGEYQRAGMCTPAAALYRRALVILPTRPDARAGLADCLWRVGDYAGSRAQARIGLAYGYHAATFRRLAARADSAWRQAHPPADDRAAVSWRPVRASRQE